MTREIARRLAFHRQVVPPEWIDYNGHMSEGYYSLAFGFATDAMMDATGLDAAYREATGCSLYTVEAHLRYLRDVAEGARLAVRTRVLGVHGKKAHFTHELYVVDGAAADPAPEVLSGFAAMVAFGVCCRRLPGTRISCCATTSKSSVPAAPSEF